MQALNLDVDARVSLGDRREGLALRSVRARWGEHVDRAAEHLGFGVSVELSAAPFQEVTAPVTSMLRTASLVASTSPARRASRSMPVRRWTSSSLSRLVSESTATNKTTVESSTISATPVAEENRPVARPWICSQPETGRLIVRTRRGDPADYVSAKGVGRISVTADT